MDISITADFDLDALKDAYYYNCFLARSHTYQHL
jgi:hypothetical protein